MYINDMYLYKINFFWMLFVCVCVCVRACVCVCVHAWVYLDVGEDEWYEPARYRTDWRTLYRAIA